MDLPILQSQYVSPILCFYKELLSDEVLQFILSQRKSKWAYGIERFQPTGRK